ncbi:SMI1/KNR4 family protein [Actinosynnema sp. NPDC053489]|uniref:SMI1/KNR4 family protein n=1 Tax=Actinosynnema sp. NPDC053489 TaxID=3363916 RepID=UPI0037C772FC
MAGGVVEDIRRFAAALVELGVARPDEVLGCGADELRAVSDRAGGFPLPAHYLAFLRLMGRRAGRLFRGTDVCFPEPVEANDHAREFHAQDPRLELADRFFFATHQGYQFYFFDRASPDAVFLYTEGEEEARPMAPTFLEFLWQSARAEAIGSTTGL